MGGFIVHIWCVPWQQLCHCLQAGRMPPLHSSNIAMDTLTGQDETVEFSDYLNGKKSVALTCNNGNFYIFYCITLGHYVSSLWIIP